MMKTYVLFFREIDRTKAALAGGKGAGLGELCRISEINVPPGFCVTTKAYKRVTEGNRALSNLLEELAGIEITGRERISATCAEIRKIIESVVIPPDITEEIRQGISSLGEQGAYAVRSSATAEDLPTASFAGQQDTYLNIVGEASVLQHIRKCWASLFTDRAVIYRMQNGFDHRKVLLSVVVQKMIVPQAAGILFTADPITSNRKIISIDAGFGLGEAMVSGRVSADNYKVSDGTILSRKISIKKMEIQVSDHYGTIEREIHADRQNTPVLTDEQVLQLERIGRKIEKHFGSPQDIEWCLADGTFYVVQSRPVTTLFPVPETSDQDNHVYISVGHQQMMTDAMKPLGLSFFLSITMAPMRKAGGRLFVDVTPMLTSPSKREMMVEVLGKSDPLLRDALRNIIARKDFIKSVPDEENKVTNNNKGRTPADYNILKDHDPGIVQEMIRNSQASIDGMKQNIPSKSGVVLVDFILEDIQVMKKFVSDPQSFSVFMSAMNASTWLNDKIYEWLGEKNVADTLTLSAPNNITSEMGLALLDVADAIRPYPEVIRYLQNINENSFMDDLLQLQGGKEARDAIVRYLDKYGMRCGGEIDITKPRWSEKPATIIPLILNNVKTFAPGESRRKFEQGRQTASGKEEEILARLKALPDGDQKAAETKRMIRLVRNFIGYREYPKYAIVCRLFVYKQALLAEAERLVKAGVIQDKEDIFYLTLEEIREVLQTRKADHRMISDRKEEYRSFEKLTPPRVITSDGEIVTGRYNHEDIPPGALAGLAVSSGTVEGRARVILDMRNADMEEGDILVTAFTDPSWTPLFVLIRGLVTEVGGLMTHGAVIAREYGLPAVVGVENATRLIREGQRIRVNGTEGFVEILE